MNTSMSNFSITILFVLLTLVSLECFASAENDVDTNEALSLLTKPRGELTGERVEELLNLLISAINTKQQTNLISTINKELGSPPKAILRLGSVSEENCASYDHMNDLDALIDEHRYAIKVYLEQAYKEQERICEQTFEQRLRRGLDELDPKIKKEALNLAGHFPNGAHNNPYEYKREHLFDGSIRVLEKYISSSKGQPDDARDLVFKTCEEVTNRFNSFLWPLMRSKSKKPLELNQDELAFLSLVKICAYMPYDDMDENAVSWIEILKSERNKSWDHGGFKGAMDAIGKYVKNLKGVSGLDSMDLSSNLSSPSEQDIELALREYLQSNYHPANMMKRGKIREKPQTAEQKQAYVQSALEKLEYHCQRLIEHFDPYLFLIEKLHIKPNRQEPEARQVFSMTKICKWTMITPEETLSSDQMSRLSNYWIKHGGSSSGFYKFKSKLVKLFQPRT